MLKSIKFFPSMEGYNCIITDTDFIEKIYIPGHSFYDGIDVIGSFYENKNSFCVGKNIFLYIKLYNQMFPNWNPWHNRPNYTAESFFYKKYKEEIEKYEILL